MKCEYGKGVVGNSIDLKMECEDPSVEIRADIKVDEFNAKRIWGQILNCHDEPVANSLVKLVKITCYCGKKHYEGIAHTITDCEGFYQFDVCQEEGACYKIIVNKAVTGPERIIETGGGNCHACERDCYGQKGNYGYDACKQYEPIVTPYDPHACDCCEKPCRPKPPCKPYPPCDCYEKPCGCYEKPCGCKEKPCDCYEKPYQCKEKPCGCKDNGCKCCDKDMVKTNYASYTR